MSFSGAYTVFILEATVNPAFHNFQDVLWWSFATITSVGYGDKVPITGAGRAVATLLMMTGVGVCGYISAWSIGLIALDEEKKEQEKIDAIGGVLNNVSNQLDVLESRIDTLEIKIDKIISFIESQ